MTLSMPQEIEVWYLIPALRRELVSCFINDHKLSQKEAASILDITESAVSQYRSSKRAKQVKFTSPELKNIKKCADKMVKDSKNASKYMYELSVLFRGSETLCKAHRKHDAAVPKKCDVCSKYIQIK
ncbi:hypothetical protein GOV09_04280 [Candidatus Woesearchaeota archaeon]|nr:hypothetical protein [Candidatus Woesearchaeota archaeon]